MAGALSDLPMTMARYGIYYAPPLGSALWQAGCRWLGRDAASGDAFSPPGLKWFTAEEVSRVTAGPRHYGFHATMKAPFELAKGKTESGLLEALRAFAARQAPFQVPLSVQALGTFVALRPSRPSEALSALHRACVQEFEPFRAPLSEPDIARRRKLGLTPDQEAKMLEWGYPYIFDGFRFHMTLTGPVLKDGAREALRAALASYFADILDKPHCFDGIAIYRQRDREAPFCVLRRFSFG